MQARLDQSRTMKLLSSAPTVGALVELCEQNYRLVLSLAPDLVAFSGLQRSQPHGTAALHLHVLEQTSYTTLVRLTHLFVHDGRPDPDPDIHLRLYHDACQSEVISLRQSILPLERLYHHPGLEQKWRANQFLSRWLQFCLLQGHQFRGRSASTTSRARSADPVPA